MDFAFLFLYMHFITFILLSSMRVCSPQQMPVSVESKLLSVVVLLLVFVLTVDYNPEYGFGHKI